MVVGEGLSEEMVLGQVLRDAWPCDSSREECSRLKEKQVQRPCGGDSSRFKGQTRGRGSRSGWIPVRAGQGRAGQGASGEPGGQGLGLRGK